MNTDLTPGPQPEQTLRDAYVAFAKAIADRTRLDMLLLIGESGERPCTELERRLPIGKSTISYHVKILTQAGLIKVRKQGRYFHYELQKDTLDYFAPDLLARILPKRQEPGTSIRAANQ